MKKQILTLVWLCLLAVVSTTAAQNIAGKVTDVHSMPVDGATVVLQTADSIFADATITDTTGYFRFDRSLPRYRLIFQHVLYETLQTEGSADAPCEPITLQSKDYTLDEIVVKGERPLVKVEKGKLLYDVSGLTENKVVSNAYECLQQLPGVQEINGNLSLAGAHSLHLVLNGKPTTMSHEQLIALLKNTPASRVDKAEVMYSAPPRYQVRGAVINLVLKGYRPGESGIQGEVNAGYSHNYKSGAETGASLVYTTEKWNVDFLYNARYRHNRQTTALCSRHTLDETLYCITQQNIVDKKEQTHHVRLGAEYKVREGSNLSVVYTGAFSPVQRNPALSAGNFATSRNVKKGNNQMHNIALDYISAFGMKAGVNYTSYRSESNQDFLNLDSKKDTSRFRTEGGQKIDRWKVYLDQSHELPHGVMLDYGTSFAYAGDHNTQFYHPADGVDRGALNTDSRYNEYTYTVYAGVGKSMGERLSFQISVAGEFYKMARYHGWSVYPAASMTYTAGAAHILQLSFSSDKTYPAYWDLSESTGYLNGYEEVQGNPMLKPSTDYSVSLNYIGKQKYIFNLAFDYEPGTFQQLAYQSPERLTLIYKTLNWDYQQSFTATVVLPFRIGNWLDSRATLQGSYRRAKCDPFFDISFDHDKWIGLGMLEHTITLSTRPTIRMELTGLYLSPSIQGSYTLNKVWAIHTGLRWDFAGRKASLQLKATDLFNSMQGNLDVNLRNRGQDMDMHSNAYSRSIRLTFTYQFGGYKARQRKEVDTSRFR